MESLIPFWFLPQSAIHSLRLFTRPLFPESLSSTAALCESAFPFVSFYFASLPHSLSPLHFSLVPFLPVSRPSLPPTFLPNLNNQNWKRDYWQFRGNFLGINCVKGVYIHGFNKGYYCYLILSKWRGNRISLPPQWELLPVVCLICRWFEILKHHLR